MTSLIFLNQAVYKSYKFQIFEFRQYWPKNIDNELGCSKRMEKPQDSYPLV